MHFSTGRMVERFPGLLATWQWVMLAGAAAIALRASRILPAYSPEGMRAWLSPPTFPVGGKPHHQRSTSQAWKALMDQVWREVPESALTLEVLHALVSDLQADLIAGNHTRIADDLLQAWSDDMDASDDAPLPQITALMVELTRAKSGEHVRCAGRGAEPAAIHCLQSGRIPIVDPQSAPVMALIYALILDLPVELDRLTSDGEVAGEIIVPDRFAPDWNVRHSDALALGVREGARSVVVLVPNRILFSRAATTRELRRSLVESHRLRAIIGFPQGTLTASEAPFSIVWFDSVATDASVTTFVKADEELHFNYTRGQLRTRGGTFTGAKQIQIGKSVV